MSENKKTLPLDSRDKASLLMRNRPDATPEQIQARDLAALEIAYAASESKVAQLYSFLNRCIPHLQHEEQAMHDAAEALVKEIIRESQTFTGNSFLADASRLDKLQRILDASPKAVLFSIHKEKTLREQIDLIDEEDVVAPDPKD
jgi:hypothetical protein